VRKPLRRKDARDGQQMCNLLSLPGAPAQHRSSAAYLNVGKDALLGYVRDGTLAVVRPTRPHDPRMTGYRQGRSRRKLASSTTTRCGVSCSTALTWIGLPMRGGRGRD